MCDATTNIDIEDLKKSLKFEKFKLKKSLFIYLVVCSSHIEIDLFTKKYDYIFLSGVIN